MLAIKIYMQYFRIIVKTYLDLAYKKKALDNEFNANGAQYNLDREGSTIYTLSLGKLDRYEYLTVEYLGYKTGADEEAKFKYFPLDHIFN